MTLRRPDLTVACVALAATGLLLTFDPATTWWFPSCPLRTLTGWLCPLCGSLRAVHTLLEGRPEAAWALNPVVTAGLPFALLALAHDALRPARPRQFDRLTRLLFSARGLAAVVAFSLFRNLPAPFGWVVR